MSQREEECFGGRRREEREKRDWFGLVEFGFFLILIGTILLVTPSISGRIENFIKDFEIREIYPGVFLPAPLNDHPTAYKTGMYFCLAFGVFEIIILILRFVQKSPFGKKAGTLGGIVFWLGAAIFANALVTGRSANWFLFIGGLIVSIGLSIMVRALASVVSRSA
jgi:drug/metabolite transporter superfamily protein YnfA